jgi:CheY-like chemotaxis protein
VEIEVSDTGVGIAPEDLPRIWTPFFTTKASDVGTGLGLSISREIVERAGGTIRAQSPAPGTDPPRGSLFTITLPAAGRAETVTPIQSPIPRIRTQRARVLVIEDEPSLARALADELGRVHDVTLAAGAAIALERMAEDRYDVVLCDLRMPGMSGEALFADVLARDPSQAGRFIFMTGVGFGADVERFLAGAGRPVLEKPFATIDALEAIRKLVAKSALR